MRSILLGVFCALMALAVTGCASSDAKDYADIEVEAATNPRFDLNGYKTYAWAAAAAAVRDPDGDWTPTGLDVGSEIMFLVDRELRDRGRSAVIEDPDLLAIYAVGVDMKALDVKVDPEDRVMESQINPRGGVMIVLVDNDTRRAIWIGRAVGDISDKPSIDLTKRRLDNAITRMFAKFPKLP
jgi:hypothetical protein